MIRNRRVTAEEVFLAGGETIAVEVVAVTGVAISGFPSGIGLGIGEARSAARCNGTGPPVARIGMIGGSGWIHKNQRVAAAIGFHWPRWNVIVVERMKDQVICPPEFELFAGVG